MPIHANYLLLKEIRQYQKAVHNHDTCHSPNCLHITSHLSISFCHTHCKFLCICPSLSTPHKIFHHTISICRFHAVFRHHLLTHSNRTCPCYILFFNQTAVSHLKRVFMLIPNFKRLKVCLSLRIYDGQ